MNKKYFIFIFCLNLLNSNISSMIKKPSNKEQYLMNLIKKLLIENKNIKHVNFFEEIPKKIRNDIYGFNDPNSKYSIMDSIDDKIKNKKLNLNQLNNILKLLEE